MESTLNSEEIKSDSTANPYGANGAISDPREQECWDNYVKTVLENKPNAYQSAIDAGYAQDTARNITMNDWFKERLGKLKRKEMLSKAERNLDNVLDLEVEEEEGKIVPQLLKIKTDVSTTIVKTLGKEEYSERSELTGKGGKDLNTLSYEQANAILERRTRGTESNSPE